MNKKEDELIKEAKEIKKLLSDLKKESKRLFFI